MADSPLVFPTRYTVSMLTSAANQGKVARRDELVKEVCWLAGVTVDASIPPSLRRNPRLFFEMWEKLRDKARKMITEANNKLPASAASRADTLLASAVADGSHNPGLSEVCESEASSAAGSSAKFMLAYLTVNGKILKTKRISMPDSLSSLRDGAVSTFALPLESDLAFEVLEAKTQEPLAACMMPFLLDLLKLIERMKLVLTFFLNLTRIQLG